MSYHIVIADDQQTIRNGLRRLIEEEDEDFKVSGEAADGMELLALLSEHQPDLVILDISMPRMPGLEAARRIRSSYPLVKILIFTMYEDEEYRREALSMGIEGYLTKTDEAARLISAIRGIRSGAASVPNVH